MMDKIRRNNKIQTSQIHYSKTVHVLQAAIAVTTVEADETPDHSVMQSKTSAPPAYHREGSRRRAVLHGHHRPRTPEELPGQQAGDLQGSVL